MSTGITAAYRGEGPNVSTGNGGGAAPPDQPAKSFAGSASIGSQRGAACDRVGRIMVDNGPARQSAAINVGSADQVLSQCTRWVLITTAGTLAVRLADDAADQTFNSASLAVGWYQLAVAIVRKTGTTAAGVLLF